MIAASSEDLITSDPLVLVDTLLLEWFRSHATPLFTEGMRYVSMAASTPVVIILSAIMTCVLLWKWLWYWLLVLGSVVAGGMLLNMLLKHLFGRTRPRWADVALADVGFPRGRTMMATIIYGFAATYLVLHIKSW